MASISDQRFLIQREAVPGDGATDAMRAYMGLRMTPGWDTDGESHRGAGYRATTARTVTSESGAHSVEAPQDFNAILPVFASILTAPVSALAEGATSAHEHRMTLKGRGKRSPVTFSALYGDEDSALAMAYFVFNELTYGVQRGELTFDTAAISETPQEGATLPAEASIEEIPAVPIPSRAYDVFIDDTWATLGTTQLLAAYEAAVSIGETWVPDAPINSAIVSFAELVEGEEVEYSGTMQVGLKSEAAGLLASFKAGATKYVRIRAEGPEIEPGFNYSVQIDYPVLITSPGEVTKAPNSPTVVLPFDYELTPDPVTGNLVDVTVVNAVEGL